MTIALASPLREETLSSPPDGYKPPSFAKLGSRMRAARTRCGYSQGDIASLLGVAKQSISNWETMGAPPGLESLIRFAAVTHTDVAELFTGLSEDLEPAARRRLAIASQLVPLHAQDIAGALLMGTIELKERPDPERFIATLEEHPPESVAFTVQGTAMEPRFREGDVVTIIPAHMAARGNLVLAHVEGRWVFRRFLPQIDGKTVGATLRALNSDFADIVMQKGDSVVGLMWEHTSAHHHD